MEQRMLQPLGGTFYAGCSIQIKRRTQRDIQTKCFFARKSYRVGHKHGGARGAADAIGQAGGLLQIIIARLLKS
jgi:hypothetical protein